MAAPGQAGLPLSGVRGRVQVSAVNFPLDHWDFEPTADLDDTTTFEDFFADGTNADGFTIAQVDVDGVRRGSGTISGYWNSAIGANPIVLGLRKGNIVDSMNLYVDRIGNRGYFLTHARIVSTPTTVDVGGGKIKFACKFKSYGGWADPV